MSPALAALPAPPRLRRAAVLALLGPALAACARDGNAQTAASTSARDDTASVARLLNAVRGVDPLLCELATRSVDTRGWWSRWGGGGAPMASNPLDVDSASAALIAWIQRKHTDPVVVPRLRVALRDADACVRRIAGSFLGRVEHATAIATLISALDDANAETRYVAALGLGLAERPAAATEPLIRLLRDASPKVRRAAAWALGSIEAPGALVPLIEALQRDSDPSVRQAAAWALGRVSG